MPASYYHLFYIIIVTLFTFIVMSDYIKLGYFYHYKYGNSKLNITFCLAVFLILWIGFRPVSGRYFVDMAGYDYQYSVLYNSPFYFDWNANNLLFDNMMAWMASLKIDVAFFFLLMAFIYFGCMLWASMKLFPKDSFLAFVVYLGAFSTFSFGTNGIKAGAAASIYLVALGFFRQNNKIMALLFLLISLGFHHSMMVPFVAFIIAYFYKKPKIYLYGWLFCLLLATLHITFFMNLFSNFTDEHGAEYLNEETEDAVLNVSGFRPDFYLYSAVPIFIGYYLINTKKIKNKTYHFLWCVYTLTNCVFLLCTYGSFINRIAYLSWLMLPFVLLYPFTNIMWSKQQGDYLKYVVFGHLGFTLFMFFIYDNLR